MTNDLQTEFQTYCRELPAMLAGHNGQYVVIKGSEAKDFFPTYEDALTWAFDHFGLGRVFVRKVTEDLAAAHFTRDLG